MATDMRKYGPGWTAFSNRIRFERAQSQCECQGQCGMHTPNPHPRRCVERHAQPARWFKGRVTLTVAHLCACAPPCLTDSHVIAACQRCHLRIDRYKHAQARAQRKKQLARTVPEAPSIPTAVPVGAPLPSQHPIEEGKSMRPQEQHVFGESEVGLRIARHAASYCAEMGDFASATLISSCWHVGLWRLFLTTSVRPA